MLCHKQTGMVNTSSMFRHVVKQYKFHSVFALINKYSQPDLVEILQCKPLESVLELAAIETLKPAYFIKNICKCTKKFN